MSRYRTYGPRDDPPELDGDERIYGVKLRPHPSQLPPGYCAKAVNLRFREGIPDPRLGTVHLPWLNKPAVVPENDPTEVPAIMEEGGVPGAILDEGGAAILEE